MRPYRFGYRSGLIEPTDYFWHPARERREKNNVEFVISEFSGQIMEFNVDVRLGQGRKMFRIEISTMEML